MAGSNNERMASVEVEGKRVPLTAAGLESVRGSKAEVAAKVGEALMREANPEG